MAIKKSKLYRSMWKSCDELRGGIDTSQYKDYALVKANDLKGIIDVAYFDNPDKLKAEVVSI